jgi:type I restriction enzyme S subunit
MEVKPRYKRTEVGMIPEDWHPTNIANLAVKVGSGITPTGGSSNYKEYGRPFVRSQNVGWGKLLLSDLVFIDEDTHNNFSATELRLGDVLLNITGASIGRSAVADTRLVGGNVNQHVCIIRVDSSEVASRFINYFVLSRLGQQQIDSFQAGGNRQGLNFGQIRSIQLPLPATKAEQEAIAEALSDADALIESLEQLIAKKRNIKQGAMQELLTGKKRLPGYALKWESRRFSDIAQLRKERIDPRGTPSQEFCIELEHIEPGTGNLIGYTSTEASSSLKSLFRKDDVLFGKLRAYLRKYWLASRHGVCSTEIWVLAAKRSLVIPMFLFQLVKMESFVETASSAYGTHMPRSDWNVVKNYEVHFPSIDEQTVIGAILCQMDAEIAALDSKLLKLRQIKQGMMQELLTGRIRLV